MVRVVYAHNGCENETTGLSPFEMILYGTPARTPEKVYTEKKVAEEADVMTRKEHCAQLHAVKDHLAQQATEATVSSQRNRIEECVRRGEQYKVGDRVRIQLSTSERGKLGGKRMAPMYSDIYVVKEVLGEGWTYLLTPANGKLKDKARHFNNLKKAEVTREIDVNEEVDFDTIEFGPEVKVKVPKQPTNGVPGEGLKKDITFLLGGHIKILRPEVIGL